MTMDWMGPGPLLLVFFLLLLAMLFWWRTRILQNRSGLPDGRVIYTDTGTWYANEEPLHAPDLRLTGKPDYLVEQTDGMIIPVEVKSSRAPEAPWEGHLLQLAAYCLLVEENYGIRPSYGIIQYRDTAFAIDYTADLEDDLLAVITEMHEARFEGELDRDHNDWHKCANCGVKSSCLQNLA